MSITISQAKDELTGMLHGTSLNKVQNLYGVFNRAAREFLADLDPETTRRTQAMANAIYNKIYDYSVPTDLKGDAVINIKTTSTDVDAKDFRQVHEKKFNVDKEDYTFDVLMNSGVKYVQLSRVLNNSLALNTADSLTANGTWSVGEDGTGLILDEVNYVSGNASLKFNSSGVAGNSTIQNTTMTAVDLTDYNDVGSIFLWVYIPDATLATSFKLDWGNDVTVNYWSDTITTPHFGSFVTGWNLLRFDWDGAIETGAPVVSTVDSLKLTYNYTAGTVVNNIRLDNVLIQIGTLYDMSYYSKYLFQNSSTNVWQEEVSSDSDIINLDGSCFNIYLFKLAQFVAAQINDNKEDSVYYATLYANAMSQYKRMYASDKQKKTQTYYNM